MVEQHAGRLRLVVAAAGYGKTTALRRLYPEPAARWLRGGELDALDTDRIHAIAIEAGQLVLDGLPQLPELTEKRLLDTVAHLPDGVEVALSSRWPLPGTASAWLAHSAPVQLRPADLALAVEKVEALLDGDYGLTGPDLPRRVHEVTAGWPVLVRLVAESLLIDGVPDGPLLAAVTAPGGLVAEYVTEEVLAPLKPDLRDLLRRVADMGPVSAGLCAAIGADVSAADVSALVRIGVLTRTGPSRTAARPWCRWSPPWPATAARR